MSFAVEIGIMRKKQNSLSTTMTAVKTYNCTLLDKTSIVRPTFRVREPMSPYPFSMCNYCHCAEFKRYYFIQDIYWTQEGWCISCQSDPLASHKLAIISSHDVYIERAEADFDGRLTDNLYPVKPDPLTYTKEIESPWTQALLSGGELGTYVISVQGTTTTYIAFYGPESMKQFFGMLYSDIYCDSIFPGGHVWIEMFKQMKAQLNIPQYINSIEWFPYIIPMSKVQPVAGTAVGFGYVGSGGQNLIIDPGVDVIELEFDISGFQHPQAPERGEYLNWAPYSEYYICVPPFGISSIPQTYINDLHGVLKAQIVVDLHTGMGRLEVHEQNDFHKPFLIQSQGKISIPIKYTSIVQLGTSGFDIVSKALTAGTGIAGNVATGNIAGAVGNVSNLATGIVSSYASGLLPVANTSGSTGGSASLYGNAMVSAVYHTLVDEDKELYGRPLYKLKTINELQGFIKVANIDNIDVGDATVEEMQEIRRACLEGIYNEA